MGYKRTVRYGSPGGSLLLRFFYSGFTRGEYHVVCVDFIYSSRGRLERDRGFANPLSLSNTSPDPFGNPLRRGILAAAVDRDLGFRYPVLSLLARCECSFAICVRRCIVRVSVGLFGWCRSFFMIGGGAVRSCGYVGFGYNLSLDLR